MDFVTKHYQFFVPHREVESLSVDVGYARGFSDSPDETAVEPLALREVGSGLGDRTRESLIVDKGTGSVEVEGRRWRAGWRAALDAQVDVKSGGVLVRVSPKYFLGDRRKVGWTMRDTSSLGRKSRKAANLGLSAKKALPQLTASFRHAAHMARTDRMAPDSWRSRAQYFQMQVGKAKKALRGLDAAMEVQAGLEGICDYSARARGGARVGVRITINGRLVRLDEAGNLLPDAPHMVRESIAAGQSEVSLTNRKPELEW